MRKRIILLMWTVALVASFTLRVLPNGGSESADSSTNHTERVVMVWIPKYGSKYHSNPACSNMKNPTKVTEGSAEAMGYAPCKNCYT